MLTKLPLGKKEVLCALLDVFEQNAMFAPTNWGKDERARLKYSREEFLSATEIFTEQHYAGISRTKKKPGYRGYFRTGKYGLSKLDIDFAAKSLAEKHLVEAYSWSMVLADTLQTEFGVVHQIRDYKAITNFYGGSGHIDKDYLQGYGLDAVCARTWFGPHVSSLIGDDLFNECNVPITKTSWGGIRLDLIESPWLADDKALMERQDRVMPVLKKSGVFADFSGGIQCRFKKGERWIPIPWKA
jgi:hypothetical protein